MKSVGNCWQDDTQRSRIECCGERDDADGGKGKQE